MNSVDENIRVLLVRLNSDQLQVHEFQQRLEPLFNQYPPPVDEDMEKWFGNVICDLEEVIFTKKEEKELRAAKQIANSIRELLDL